MNLLPAPFPIEEILSERELRHVKRLYGIGGLSYGNLSARKDGNRFWMSASGVNKAKLETVGRDILMINGYSPEEKAMRISVPPKVEPRRASVDAIEHWMIYTNHPEVGAIVHIHAWMEGIPTTEINYPCGTLQLAKAVAEQMQPRRGSLPGGRRPEKPRPDHHRPRSGRHLRADRGKNHSPSPHVLRRESMRKRIVLVTGASSGIGREIARLLARRGDFPVLAARRAKPSGS